MKNLVQYINEAKESMTKEYSTIKNKLSRHGFAPRGRNDEEWDFESIDRKSGDWYSVRVFLDENGNPFEYTLSVCDSDEIKFDTLSDLIITIKETKKKIKESKDDETVDVIFKKIVKGEYKGDVIAFFPYLQVNQGKILSYEHDGQHSEASMGFYDSCRPASSEEYSELYNELTNVVGYKLNVVRRINPNRQRKEAWV